MGAVRSDDGLLLSLSVTFVHFDLPVPALEVHRLKIFLTAKPLQRAVDAWQWVDVLI